MSLQHWYTAASTIALPFFSPGMGAGYGSAQQLRRLFWQTGAEMLVGQFQLETTDYSLTNQAGGVVGGFFGRAMLQRLWRDGSVVQWDLLTQQQGLFYSPAGASPEAPIIQVFDGRLGRGIGNQIGGPQPNYNALLAATDPPAGIYLIDTLWTGDLQKPRLGTLSWISATNVGILFPSQQKAWTIRYVVGAFELREVGASGSTLRFTQGFADNSYRHARDLLYLTSTTMAILFRQSQTGAASTTPDVTVPALIRVLDTTSTTYTLLWEDTLPVTDAVACYDAQRQILYSAPKFAPLVLHASRPKPSPTYIFGPSVVSGTVLRTLTATRLQAQIQNARSANISNVVVQWSLTSQTSGGILLSQYGITNTSGIAFAFYAGPVLSGALTETISVAVATVE